MLILGMEKLESKVEWVEAISNDSLRVSRVEKFRLTLNTNGHIHFTYEIWHQKMPMEHNISKVVAFWDSLQIISLLSGNLHIRRPSSERMILFGEKYNSNFVNQSWNTPQLTLIKMFENGMLQSCRFMKWIQLLWIEVADI